MKKLTILVLACFILALTPVLASAGSVEGTVQGLQCVTTGKVCPVGKEDPMAAAERVFVILTQGGDYYFVPNVDRAVMARHINEMVKVTGTINPKYNAINATHIEAYSKGAWKVVWSQEEQDRLFKSPWG